MSGIAVILGAIWAVSVLALIIAGLLWKLSRRFRHSLVGEQTVPR